MSARMSQDVWNFSQGRGLWFLLHKALKVSYRKCSTAKDESVHVALTRACRGDLVIQGASEDCSIVLQSSKTLASFWENRIHAWQTNVVAEHAQLYQRLARGTKAISWIYGVLQARSYIWNVFGPYWFWRGGLIQLHAETRSLALNFFGAELSDRAMVIWQTPRMPWKFFSVWCDIKMDFAEWLVVCRCGCYVCFWHARKNVRKYDK